MKRTLYCYEILICLIMVVFTICHWRIIDQFELSMSKAAIHIPALLAYGILILLRLKDTFGKFEPLSKRFTISSVLLFSGCMLFILVPFLTFFSSKFVMLTALIISIILSAIPAIKLKGRSKIKIIISFVLLGLLIWAAAIFCGLSGAAPIDLQRLTEAELNSYNMKDYFKSIGGAAAYCWLPIIIVFCLADSFSDEMILEETNS